MDQIELAIQKFVADLRKKKLVIGAILTGSYAHGPFDAHSDVDIYVILDSKCTFRERGNTWINGIEIEYFKNPPVQIRQYFNTEKSPHTAHMLAHGKILFQKEPLVAQLIKEAEAIWNRPPDPLKHFQIELAKYGLDDLEKDLNDALLNKDGLAVELIRADIIKQCIDVFFQLKRERRYKNKRLNLQIQQLDPVFLRLLENSFLEINNTFKLIQYTEKLLGGKRTTEWALRSPLDIDS